MIDCSLYCPGRPRGDHGHNHEELWAAIQRPTGVILSCGVTYARVLRVKREVEQFNAQREREFDDTVMDDRYAESIFGDPHYDALEDIIVDSECYVCDRPQPLGSDGLCDDCRTSTS